LAFPLKGEVETVGTHGSSSQ